MVISLVNFYIDIVIIITFYDIHSRFVVKNNLILYLFSLKSLFRCIRSLWEHEVNGGEKKENDSK